MPRFRSRHILAAATAVLALAACSSSINFLPPEDPETALFEVESRNTAWSFHWSGFYVDAEGRVYRWDRTHANDASLADSVLTPEQLAQKFTAGRTLVRTLPAGEALQRYQLLSDAARGGLAEPMTACADAGITRLSAWVQRDDGKYHRILLHQRGDVATTRRSNAARTLWRWLNEATRGEAGPAGCDPYGEAID